ncbi:MAG: Gfo/Idh/MocA family oxidoreductase [Clostridiaceae bacterium]|nr:Gfo/Idh/MocA family oxidoreductase [Clostridiaceae bacterium]
MKKIVRYGIVGASLDSFIGAVHTVGAGFDGLACLSAGCFSRNKEKNQESGEFYQIDPNRVYSDYQEMAEKEGAREDKIDFVTISTPNNAHYEIAKAFLENGISVLCEKPLCFEISEAEHLKSLVEEKDLLFCVNYSYSGNNLVKEARELVQSGHIGDIINVNAEYLQEYLVDDIGKGDQTITKLSSWRKNPEIAGISNCVGDIGSHIENTVSYITGLRLKRVAAKLDYFGQPLDLNANILVEFENGAHGVFCSSQVCVGYRNGLVVRIFGTEGSIEWVQEEPNTLIVAKKGQPVQIYHRGMAYLSDVAQKINRLPTGHPEGLYVAFANIYKNWIGAILKKANGEELSKEDRDFPSIEDGIEGVKFIHACVKSSEKDAAWVNL